LSYKSNLGGFIKFKVKLHLAESFKVEWCGLVHNSFSWVRFGHGQKKSTNQFNAIFAHLKKVISTSKMENPKSSREDKCYIVVFLTNTTLISVTTRALQTLP